MYAALAADLKAALAEASGIDDVEFGPDVSADGADEPDDGVNDDEPDVTTDVVPLCDFLITDVGADLPAAASVVLVSDVSDALSIGWYEQVLASWAALVSRSTAFTSFNAVHGRPTSLVMVDIDGCCDFWYVRATLQFDRDHRITEGQGQRVRLDRHNQVICCMPWLDKIRNLVGGIIVHAHTGIVMMKVKGRDRDVVPESLMSLKTSWNVGSSMHSIDNACNMCKAGSHEGDAIFTCPMCLLTVHEQCTVQCSRTFPPMEVVSIPNHWKICSACSKVVQDNDAHCRGIAGRVRRPKCRNKETQHITHETHTHTVAYWRSLLQMTL